MLPFVTDVPSATAAIRAFHKDRAKYADVMPHARAWYAMPVDGGYLLGPSKVIGYRGMTPDYYFKHNATALDGRSTESALRSISEPVPADSVLHRELARSLSDMCALYGTKPNKLVRFSLLGGDLGEKDVGQGDRFAEVMAGAYARMTKNEQQQFRRLTRLTAA